MDALECAALPVFSTRTTEDQHLLPEQGRPVCSQGPLQRAHPKLPLQRRVSGGAQPCPFSWEGTKDRWAMESRELLACLLNSSSFSIHMYSAKGLSSSWECPLMITSSLMMLGLVLLRLGSFMAATPIPNLQLRGAASNTCRLLIPCTSPAQGNRGCSCTQRLQAALPRVQQSCEITARSSITSTVPIVRGFQGQTHFPN